MLGGTVTATPEFDHASSKMDLEFEIVNSVSPFTEINIPKVRYPSGVTISLSPVSDLPSVISVGCGIIFVFIIFFFFYTKVDGLELEVNEKGNLVIKHGKDELNGKVLKLSLVKKSSGPFSISVNGAKLFPAG